jgi:hypothetical protein
MATKLAKRRVHIPARHWTAFSIRVFDSVLPELRRRHSALVYLVLYHHAWHDKRKKVHASFETIAGWSGLDYRTVQKCIRELEFKRSVIRTSKGTQRSRNDLPVWRVPAAEFDMGKEGWVPVPSFIVTCYLPVCPACALLPLFLYYQNIQKLNYSWMSALTLSIKAGWFSRSRHRIYDAINLMGNQAKWKELGTGLPRPLSISRAPGSKPDTWIRHYQVRAIYYHCERKNSLPELYLTKEFSRFFEIKAEITPQPPGSHDA